ncbi:MAG: Gfo/Idh/MocA family oxidoreductase, partial [Nitrospirae bacterium]|nr:Gfo/Idh/MocA family oxidoreductase [Nitrospirota bacterium]
MYKAAVIGLGNIGFRFNLDPKRKETWSHVAAYERCKDTELAAAVEINPDNIETFKKQYPQTPVFSSVREMMESMSVDIVSICTPTDDHHSVLEELVAYPIRAIFCEKPFAGSLTQAEQMIRLCEGKNIVLAVNHTRRWDEGYISVRDMIRNGKVGDIKTVNAVYSGQIFNIGTHLIDTVRMFVSKEACSASGISHNLDNPDPGISGWVDFDGKVPFVMTST